MWPNTDALCKLRSDARRRVTTAALDPTDRPLGATAAAVVRYDESCRTVVAGPEFGAGRSPVGKHGELASGARL